MSESIKDPIEAVGAEGVRPQLEPITLQLNSEEIKIILPHRDPMLWVQRVSAFDMENKTLTAHCFLNKEADCFRGHFPGHPLFPGVLQTEALAQAAGILGALLKIAIDRDGLNALVDKQLLSEKVSSLRKGKVFCLIDSQIRYAKPIYPEDTMNIVVTLLKSRSGIYKFSGSISVEGDLCCRGKVSLGEILLDDVIV